MSSPQEIEYSIEQFRDAFSKINAQLVLYDLYLEDLPKEIDDIAWQDFREFMDLSDWHFLFLQRYTYAIGIALRRAWFAIFLLRWGLTFTDIFGWQPLIRRPEESVWHDPRDTEDDIYREGLFVPAFIRSCAFPGGLIALLTWCAGTLGDPDASTANRCQLRADGGEPYSIYSNTEDTNCTQDDEQFEVFNPTGWIGSGMAASPTVSLTRTQ